MEQHIMELIKYPDRQKFDFNLTLVLSEMDTSILRQTEHVSALNESY